MRLFIWRQIGLFRIFFASHKDEETASNWSDQRKKRCELGSVTGQAGFMSWEHFPEYSWGVKSTDNFTDLTWEGTMVIVWFSVQGMESHVTPPALFVQQRKFSGWCLQISGTHKGCWERHFDTSFTANHTSDTDRKTPLSTLGKF